MRFMNQFNRFAGKWMPLLVLCGLITGITFSETIGHLLFLVPFLFAFMTFAGTASARPRQLLDIVKKPLPLIAILLVVHVVMPLIAFTLGRLFFARNPYLITGMVLEFVVPCAVASLMWNSIAGGNVVLTLSVVLLDTLVAPFLIPFSLRTLVGTEVSIDAVGMIRDLVWMIALPAVASMVINQVTAGRAGDKLTPLLAPFGKITLILIITINSTCVAPFVKHMTPILFGSALSMLLIAMFGYTVGWLLSKILRQPDDVAVSMTFGCGMRNISAGAVIAAAYFPAEVMFPVMISTLFQQILAAFFSRMLTHLHQSGQKSSRPQPHTRLNSHAV